MRKRKNKIKIIEDTKHEEYDKGYERKVLRRRNKRTLAQLKQNLKQRKYVEERTSGNLFVEASKTDRSCDVKYHAQS